MIIRNARVEEAVTLQQIVDLANRHSGFPAEWIQNSSSDSAPSEQLLLSHRVFVAEEDGEVKGFYSMDEGGRLDQLWVLPSCLGTGCTRELFLHAKKGKRGTG